MSRILKLSSIVMACTLCSLSFGRQFGGGGGGQGGSFGGAQGGGFGGAGQGGLGGNQQNRNGQRDTMVRGIEQQIPTYLGGNEIKSVLTPGEFCEWTLKLKAGQIVLGEARSDAFDPALEIVDDKGKVLGSNDDRYPGDQRPLLLWRCEKEGTYGLHVRCFHDKSGGQFFVRFRSYECVDLLSNERVEQTLTKNGPFLLRIPMKAGQIREIVSETGGQKSYTGFRVTQIIASNGLPDINLAKDIQPVTYNTTLLAPVAGDYYALADPYGVAAPHTVYAWTRDIAPKKLEKDAAGFIGKASTNMPALWELSVKAGELIEVESPELSAISSLLVAEIPDISKYDISTPETNPFFPQLGSETPLPGPAFDRLPARERDSRIAVFHVDRDAKLWVASNGWGSQEKTYTLHVKPAAETFAESIPTKGNLRIGSTDYWQFEAKAGDVMTLKDSTAGFTPVVIVRDPDMLEIRHAEAQLDQTTDDWRMIVQKPGRYLVAVSCLGDGGGGTYSLARKVFHAKEFSISSPAKAQISSGEVQIWEFTATPTTPLYVHWSSTNWLYDVNIYDDKGNFADFQRQAIDANNAFGILKVNRRQTFVIVLSGKGTHSDYSIELSALPGYKVVSK